MTYSYPEIRQFRGRYAQRNSFEVPDGALEVANNVTVGSDFIISKRRGFYTYFTPGSGTLKALFNYEDTLISIYENQVAKYVSTGVSPNQVGSQTVISNEPGVSVSVVSMAASRSMQASENLYFTTDNGVLKLTTMVGLVQSVGSPPGNEISSIFAASILGGWIGPDKNVSYRVVFGRKDESGNLIIGAPSDITTISNPAVVDAPYSVAGAGPYTITVTNSVAHNLETGRWLQFFDANDPDAEGTYQITVTGATTFTYSVPNNPSTGPLIVSWALAEAVLLSATVPDECADVSQNWFAQIYRNDQQNIDVAPLSTFKLVVERLLTATEISTNVLFFTDTTPELLRGTELYTNENTQEGEAQANARPPKCVDLALFKNHAFYANPTIRARLECALVDPSKLASGDSITLRVVDGANFDETYVARTGVGNTLTYSASLSGSGTITVTSTGHGLLTGDLINVSNITGGSYANQNATISAHTTNTFTVTLTGSGTPTALYFEGVTNGTNPIFKLSTSSSFAVQLAETSAGIIKAISRNSAGRCYAKNLSDFTEVPGQFAIFARNFPSQLALRASSSTAGTAFSPVLPTSFASGVQVTSDVINQKHHLYISKISEPEAVPLLNFIQVGSENKQIYRIKALRDSLIVIKEDGVFKLTGDTPQNFTVTILDSTVVCVAPDSVDVINNQVAMLSTVGVVLISESSVAIISRKIEEDIRPILGRNADLAHGLAYEIDRLYLLTCSRPNDPTLSVCHVYNALTDEWTTWDKLFLSGVVGPSGILYLITTQNKILRERRSETRIDYADEFYSSSVIGVSGDGTVIDFTVSGVVPESGDILVLGNIINRIKTNPLFLNVNTYRATLQSPSTLIVGDTPIFYKSIRSTIGTAPFHAGLVGRSKQFAQMQLHFRSDQCSRLEIFFTGDVYLGSDSIVWEALWNRAGWGYFPWAFDFFGQGTGIDLPIGTSPGPICRIYVPIQQQRSSFIQTYINHTEAAEAINLQAQSWAVRSYAERVTR
jgi:hypothetical protein